ncbi:MAG: APC family permease [Planctomycetota bacterium]
MNDSTPSLRTIDIASIVISGILGVGIFFTPSRVAQAVDTQALALTAWSLGGVVALIGAFAFAALAQRLPGHGGTFRYVHAAFGRLPAFLYGWANWLVIQAGALVVIGLVMVDYASVLLFGEARIGDDARASITIVAIAGFTVLNVLGLRVGSRVQNLLTVLKTSAVFGLVALGLFVSVRDGGIAVDAPVRAARGILESLAAAMLPVLFSFGGWQQGSFVAGAAKSRSAVSLGIVGGVVVIVIAYLAVNVAFLSLLGFEGARNAPAVGASAARIALDPFGLGGIAERVLAGMVVLSALGIMNTICLAPPFVLHAMAKEGLFFRHAGVLHATRGVPVLGVIAQGSWAIALCALGQWLFRFDLGFLLDGVVFVDWLFFALCGAALLRLGATGSARVFGIAFTLAAITITVGAVATNSVPSLVGLGVVALGAVVYFVTFRRGFTAESPS